MWKNEELEKEMRKMSKDNTNYGGTVDEKANKIDRNEHENKMKVLS